MRYFGSKATAVEGIYKIVSAHTLGGTFCDPFGGIGTVGSYFKRKGFDVWTGDLLTFAYYFQVARVKTHAGNMFSDLLAYTNMPNVDALCDYMSKIVSETKWFVHEYSLLRQFFTVENALLISGCHDIIFQWKDRGLINDDETAILLASLINSVDKVANTAGTYYAHLKHWHTKSLKPFVFKLIEPSNGAGNGYCHHVAAETLVSSRHFNVLYLDPPYNDRNYFNYYHLPETLALGEHPEIHGRSGVPVRSRGISDFNRRSVASSALKSLLKVASFDLLLFHYSDFGNIDTKTVAELMSSYGRVEEFLVGCQGYSAKSRRRLIEHKVYCVHA